MSIDVASFRTAMSSIATPVTIVTTVDLEGRPAGFTASSFCSLSLDPPLLLICVDKAARCHAAFVGAPRFMVNVLAVGDEELAIRFATRGADKFGARDLTLGKHGLVAVPNAVTRLECALHAVLDGGDHSILVGRVEHATTTGGSPLLYWDHGFRRLDLPALAGAL